MKVLLRYRGRSLTEADIVFVRELIAANPQASRRALSKLLCEAWDWRQANGELCDMVCRSLMLLLHRAGHIELPAPRFKAVNNVVRRRRPPKVDADQTAISARLSEIGPLEIRLVRRTADEPLFNSLIEQHHYLNYVQPVGEQLKYLVRALGVGNRPVACMAWSSAPRDMRPRDRFIGWSLEARRANIHLLAYNPRYLIMPWVRVPHLASHLLGRIARRLSGDWERMYNHPIYYLESFILPDRFRGTCYRAANWRFLGLTAGRGNNAPTMEQTRPKKDVLGYPLRRDFRAKLMEGV